ncbi:hypothetical protein [Lysinibacillus odysseyi]|uniref:Uncharacterized protein n=1 Tax=Lysinibacillus odysseyi 34hs-1 = NBRC 100172 TaxID=1220589 RepID=A0A0A3INR5_9BACI|nr:hypothetical protein [Lysinibacillus odysseyi]KGR84468.1 hypothetical protein CD32_12855 [Lysinibacillus odysseyi 34hs-1 = NBRC 100172]
MGFFTRLFKKVEDVNKGEADISELNDELYIESALDEANDYWVEMAQNIIVNAVKATDNSVDRAFVVVDMREHPAFAIFYQVDGELVMWNQLEDDDIKQKIESELLPQAVNVAAAVNEKFVQADHPVIAYAQLQFEWATGAWFSHIIWGDDAKANLEVEEIVTSWFSLLSEEIKSLSLDSDSKLSWYP